MKTLSPLLALIMLITTQVEVRWWQPQEQAEQITELLFDMLYVLTEDLKAPRFIRTSEGSAMIEGETLLPVH